MAHDDNIINYSSIDQSNSIPLLPTPFVINNNVYESDAVAAVLIFTPPTEVHESKTPAATCLPI